MKLPNLKTACVNYAASIDWPATFRSWLAYTALSGVVLGIVWLIKWATSFVVPV